MSNLYSKLLSAFAVFVVLPVAAFESGTAHRIVGIDIAAKPVAINVNVKTAFLPLDLQKYAPSDFGDSDLPH